MSAVTASLKEARAGASLVIFTIHAHETAGMVDEMPPRDFEPLVLHRANETSDANNPVPADFLPKLFHQAIDSGADMVVRTGPHVLNGIELYKGKPIFYSLGSLFFDFGGRRSYTAPAGQVISLPDGWFETVVPVLSYRKRKLAEVRLYPAVIKAEAGLQGGLPHLATGAQAQAIIGRLRDLSKPYGTTIRIEGDIGIIRP
jgi:poly-gamma-glutamate synthesis protein (capsule biosynthesis protein)